MRRILIALILLTGLASAASAADLGTLKVTTVHKASTVSRLSKSLPFPRGERAQSVWASNACWSGCQSYCTWGENACLQVDAQGRCLKITDRCDRYCQRECRTMGGPLAAFLD